MIDFANQTLRKFTPQQRARQAAINAQNALFEKLNREELKRRDQPIKAIANAYNVTTGEWEATTPDGGTVAARSLSNANIKGKSLPVQRFQGSAQSAINERPTDANFGEVYSTLEETANNLTNLMGIQYGTGDPNNETVTGILDFTPRNSQDSFYDTDSGTLYRWDADTTAWIPVEQLWQNFAGTPAATVYIDGAIAINDSNTIYTGTVADGWTEFSAGGGGFDGVILQGFAYTGFLTAVTAHQTDFDAMGFAEQVDTANYWSSGDPTKIYFPSAGLYKVTLAAGHQVNSNVGGVTHWCFEFRTYTTGNTGGSFEATYPINSLITFPTYALASVLIRPHSGTYQPFSGSVWIDVGPTITHMELYTIQSNADEAGLDVDGNLAWGKDHAGLSVEKFT